MAFQPFVAATRIADSYADVAGWKPIQLPPGVDNPAARPRTRPRVRPDFWQRDHRGADGVQGAERLAGRQETIDGVPARRPAIDAAAATRISTRPLLVRFLWLDDGFADVLGTRAIGF